MKNYIVVGYSLHQEQNEDYEEMQTETIKENEDEYEMNENEEMGKQNLQRSDNDY